MFLKSITINNYKSIQKARVDFEKGLNIVIGKNGAGKSNLLNFFFQNILFNVFNLINFTQKGNNIEYEYCICYGDNEGKAIELTVYFKRDKVFSNNEINSNRQLRLSKKIDDVYVYQDKIFNVFANRTSKNSIEEVDNLVREFYAIQDSIIGFVPFETQSDSSWLAKPAKFEIDEVFELKSDGIISDFSIIRKLQNEIEISILEQENEFDDEIESSILDKYIDSFKNAINQSFIKLKENLNIDNILGKFSPISELRINQNINIYETEGSLLFENLIIEFRVNNSWIPWSHLSDGTKRLFYLITQTLCLTDGILLIEEPELGIHPHQLFKLMDFLKEQSRSKQIILSTHSPIVLDVLPPDELNRIIIAKLTPTGTAFTRLSDEQKETTKKYMAEVGELSYYWLHSDLEDE